ncbi:MAG: short-chain dehydrogenase/reductase [Candidatus Angelobacter sp.]|jgi:NAD(P)-dependent dehydrogenase (short-subunit alcohol dehydrogenase family)|nr:short-chain dehydrogenase/reductase [Candidatus Angelobacter sp.]
MTAADCTYLKGKHAIVTGASRGIGAAIASELARLGADLTLLGRDKDALNSQERNISAEFKVKTISVVCDISDEASVRNAFSDSQEEMGNAFVLVNNAGQSDAAGFLEIKREAWDRMIAVNLTGAFLCTQQVLAAMIKDKSGRIINIASTAGVKGYSKIAAYAAAKHGLVGLTRALAAETAKSGITVNAVCPGYTETAMSETAIANLIKAGKSEEEARKMITRTPRGSLIQPAEVANAVAWLCSPNASAITGQAIMVAGGEVTG